MHYDINQPRISIVSPGNEHGEQREQEIGQASSWNEAVFFMQVCDYRINVSHWNGRSYADNQYFTRADL